MWLARSDTGELRLFRTKPFRRYGNWISQNADWMTLPTNTFRGVKFKSSPAEVEINLKVPKWATPLHGTTVEALQLRTENQTLRTEIQGLQIQIRELCDKILELKQATNQ